MEKLEDPKKKKIFFQTIQTNNSNTMEKRRKAKLILENKTVKIKIKLAEIGAITWVPVPNVNKKILEIF